MSLVNAVCLCVLKAAVILADLRFLSLPFKFCFPPTLNLNLNRDKPSPAIHPAHPVWGFLCGM